MTPAVPTLGTDVVYTCETWISDINDTGEFLVHYWQVSMTLVKHDLTQIKGSGTGTVMHASPVSLIAVKYIQIPKLSDTNLSETKPSWYRIYQTPSLRYLIPNEVCMCWIILIVNLFDNELLNIELIWYWTNQI